MAAYLILESRDPFDSRDSDAILGLATALHDKGHTVTVFLVENAALAARAGARAPQIDRTIEAGIEVLVDEYALRARGIPAQRLRRGVRPAPLDLVVDMLAEGRKALWH